MTRVSYLLTQHGKTVTLKPIANDLENTFRFNHKSAKSWNDHFKVMPLYDNTCATLYATTKVDKSHSTQHNTKEHYKGKAHNSFPYTNNSWSIQKKKPVPLLLLGSHLLDYTGDGGEFLYHLFWAVINEHYKTHGGETLNNNTPEVLKTVVEDMVGNK